MGLVIMLDRRVTVSMPYERNGSGLRASRGPPIHAHKGESQS